MSKMQLIAFLPCDGKGGIQSKMYKLCINGETFSNNSRLATAGRDALHCHPVSVATGRHGNWGGGELVAGEEGGGEDGKGTGTNRPRLAASDQAIVESLSAWKVLFFSFELLIYSLARQYFGVFVHVNITTTDEHHSLTCFSHFCWPCITNIT